MKLGTLDTSAQIVKIATLFVTVGQSAVEIEKLVKPLRDAKIVMGTIKQNCALSLQFQAILNDAKIAETTSRNYLSAVRSAINDGHKFSFNPSREKAKANAKAKVTAKPVDAAPAGIEPIPSAPAGQTQTTPKKLISMPSDAIDAIVVALSNVRATCTQDTWLHVLTLNPALAQFLARANLVWNTPAPVVETPAPTKKTRAPKK